MKMMRDRNFNIAIIISMFSHVLCIFGIGIVISTSNIRSYDTNMAFLGSILEKISVMPEKALVLEGIDIIKRRQDSGYMYSGKIFKDEEISLDKISSVFFEKQDFSIVKQSLNDLSLETSFLKAPVRFTYKDEAIGGSARNRTLMHRPKLSSYNYPITSFGLNYKVIVGFNVAPDGTVHQPELLVSSGSSTIDEIAKKHVRKWIFTPLDKGEAYDEGKVSLVFSHF